MSRSNLRNKLYALRTVLRSNRNNRLYLVTGIYMQKREVYAVDLREQTTGKVYEEVTLDKLNDNFVFVTME